MTKTVEEILLPKPEARLRVYSYPIDDEAHQGLLKERLVLPILSAYAPPDSFA